MSKSLRSGTTVTIDNEMGHILRLTRWDDDHLTVGIHGGDLDTNVLHFEAEFGIYGFLDDLAQLFAGTVVGEAKEKQ